MTRRIVDQGGPNHSPYVQNITVDGTATIATAAITTATVTTLTTTGAQVPTGGIGAAAGLTARPTLVHTGGVPAQVSTAGFELDIVVTELYVAEVFIPCNMTITGVSIFNATNTNGNGKVCLFDSAGTRVAISASTDVSGFTADTYNRIAFSATYDAKGPATYYVGTIYDTNTHDINTHVFGDFRSGKIGSLVYATESGYATITPPTGFTANQGPIASLY